MRAFFASFVLILTLAVQPGLAVEPILDSPPDFLVSAPTNISKKLRLEANVSYIGESKFTNGLGSVNVGRLALSADYSIFNLTYGYSRFRWTDKGETSLTRVPWEGLHDLTLQGRILNNSLGDRWRYWVNGQISSAFEQDFPGAVGVGFDGGVAYDFWEGWMIGATLRSVALSPLNRDLFGEHDIGLAVAVSQKALRETMRTLGLSDKEEGAENVGISFAFVSSEKTYRLAADSPITKNGYLSILYSKIGVYFDYSPDETWTLSLGPELYYDRKYRFYDSTGSSGGSYRLGTGLGGFARVMWRY